MAQFSKDKDTELKREMESYKAALELKEEGNTFFKKGELKLALRSYSRMLIHLGMKPTFALSSLGAAAGGAMDMGKEEGKDNNPLKKLQKDADLLRKTCFNNISAVYAKMGEWKNSLEKANMVLELDDKNPKALYRIGVASRHLREYEKAKESLLNAQKVKDTAAIRNELRRVEAGLAAQQVKNDKRFRKAFKKQAAANKSKKKAHEDTKELVEQKLKKKDSEQKEDKKDAKQKEEKDGEQKEDKKDVVEDEENIKHNKAMDIDQGSEKKETSNQGDQGTVKSSEAGEEAVTNT